MPSTRSCGSGNAALSQHHMRTRAHGDIHAIDDKNISGSSEQDKGDLGRKHNATESTVAGGEEHSGVSRCCFHDDICYRPLGAHVLRCLNGKHDQAA